MGILNEELRACADSRRFFVTTNLKRGVHRILGRLSKNRDENPRMRKRFKSKSHQRYAHAWILVDLKSGVSGGTVINPQRACAEGYSSH